MFSYQQTTGKLAHNGTHVAVGYSGHGDGKNNPECEALANIGPLPRGIFNMEVITDDDGNPCDYEGKKAPVIRLHPSPTNEMYGRAGFLIHGDSVSTPGTASLGCIVENHDERVYIATAIAQGDNILEVV